MCFQLPDKRRPVLVLTRLVHILNDVIDRLNEIIVVPATRTIRGLTTEVIGCAARLRAGAAYCDSYPYTGGAVRGIIVQETET